MTEPKIRFKADDGSDFPDWDEKKLEDVVEFLDGKRKPIEAGEREAGIYPYYGASGIVDYVKDYIFDEDLILLSEDGANIIDRNSRVCFMARGKYWVNNHAHVLKAIKGNVNEFICEQLESFDYSSYNTGSAQPKINQKVCRNLRLNIPHPDEQQLIADFLSNVDEVIAASEEEVANLEQQKKTMMQKIFSQEVRFKKEDGSDFPDWEGKMLGEAITFVNGRAYKQEELLATGKYLVLRVGNLFTNNEYYYSDLELDDDKYIDNGDLIYAWSATFGPRIYQGEKCIYHYHIWKCLFDDESYSKNFLNQLLLNDVESIKRVQNGFAMMHITKENMENRVLKIPSLPEQQLIADFLTSYDEAITAAKQELAKWKELKKGMLQQMFV